MPESNYKLIRVTGSDAGEFLQGQLTQDIELVTRAGCLPTAWCNPKGRVIAVLRVLLIDGGYGLVLPQALAESVRDRLAIYRFRADVGLEIAGANWMHLVFHSDDDMTELESHDLKPDRDLNACRIDHGLIAVNIGIEETCVEVMGYKADIEKAGIDCDGHTDPHYLSGARIRAGIPEILEITSEKYTPHMLNLDLLGAISFDKGCYTGQEVVARTENLGRSKRRIMRYRTDATASIGDRLTDGDREVGNVINVNGRDLLAVTPLDLHEQILFAGDAKVVPAAMPYGTTD